MKDTLRALVELQDLEDSLRDLRVLREHLVKLTEENELTRHMFHQMLSEREAQLSEVRAFCEEKEAGIKEAEDNARRARGRLSSIQSQRELTALNKELDTARRLNAQHSEELLKLMEQLENATADYNQKTTEFAGLEAEMKQLEEDTVIKIKEGEADSTSQNDRQQELRALVDKPTLARFDRVLAGRDGRAVANVVDQTCTQCRLSISPQVFIRLMRMETLESCNNCRRILVWKEGLYPSADTAVGIEAAAPADA